ncbi:MAG: efflux RND transporter periplasmic adaptor subunit [Pseudomonadota bacterium]
MSDLFHSRTSKQLTPAFVAHKTIGLAALGLAALLTACGEDEAVPQALVARPVKIFEVDENMGDEIRRFPATIEASKQAGLRFRVSGQIVELPIREGDVVDEGQLIAKLDPTDYQNALEDSQATFDNANRNFQRAKELIESGSISQLDYDRMEADFRSSRAALAQAKTNLSYTTLRAPFRGRIAQRYYDNFEEVVGLADVVYLQDTDELDVIIAMPESVIRSVTAAEEERLTDTESIEESTAAQQVRAMASFEEYSEISFALEIKEVATRADADTQTFKMTFSMPQPDEFTVLPGMTAQVEVDFTGLLVNKDTITWVPARAVQANEQLSPRVFVLDPDTMEVRSRPVETGRMSADMIEVLSGLIGGEEIVAVGAAYLSEGMKVTRMRTGEQAIPRESDI